MTESMIYQNQEIAVARQEKRKAPPPEMPDEEQRVARVTIQRILVQFHRDWAALRSRGDGERWRSAADTLLDKYSHQLYDMAREVQAILGEDLATQIRVLSCDMIKETNILYMIGYEEEYRERGDLLAKEAIRYAEKFIIRRTILQEERTHVL